MIKKELEYQEFKSDLSEVTINAIDNVCEVARKRAKEFIKEAKRGFE